MGRWANKYVIGLTGNIATGKSLVRKMLENLGAYTIDADGLAHQAMAPGAPTYGPIVENFGKWILDADKKIDRSKLGAVAFAHNDALNLLERLTHPVIGQAIDLLISRAKQPICVVEAIKLVDGPLGGQVDSIWVVDAPPEQQLQRLMTKRGLPEYEARRRIDTQNPQQEKLARAHVVIHNGGSPDEVWAQVQGEWNRIFTGARPAAPAAPAPAARPAAPAPTGPLAAAPAMQVAMPAVQQRPAPTMAPSAAPPAPPAQPAPPAPPRPVPSAPPAAAPAPIQAAPPPPPPPPPPVINFEAPSPVRPPPQPPSSGSIAAMALDARRGGPRNVDAIARLLSQATNRQVTGNDVMLAFGEKSYVLAESGSRIVGLAGFQVENLITRMDEFYVVADAPLNAVASLLIDEVERASQDLQSEVGFIFVPRTAPPNLLQTFFAHGYERIEIETLKVPAWREAAQEMQTPERQVLMKKLRAERILKPV